MAAGDITVGMGTPVCWADTSDYNSAASGISRTHQIDLTSLADGDMWQGAKADLGATRAPGYGVKVCIEMDVAPAAGTKVEFYWSSSYSATAATGNDGGAESTGADADWDGIAGGAEGERDEYKRHLILMGVLSLGADADIPQVATINSYFCPPTRYGFPIVKNDSGQAFQGDAVEMYIALIPITENVAAS
jgi:hypothetical protein